MQKSISFNDQSIRLIRSGCKTQTRRLFYKVRITRGPELFGAVGDKLFVQESFRLYREYNYKMNTYSEYYLEYRADKTPIRKITWKKPSEMTQNESRLEITILAQRDEPVQEITDHDAIDEGVFWSNSHDGWVIDDDGSFLSESPRDTFKKWFISIYGPEPWDNNDCVVVLEFEAKQTRYKVNFFQQMLSAKG